MKTKELITLLQKFEDEEECVVYSCPMCHGFDSIKEVKRSGDKVVINICECGKW